MTSINEIQGIDDDVADRLRADGIATVEAFLERAATPSGRAALSSSTGIDPSQVLTWTNQADLFRIKGVAGHFAELLEAAGVDSVPELAQRNPERLQARLVEVNDRREVVHALPHDHDVEHWIEQARELPRVVVHRESAAAPSAGNGSAAVPAGGQAASPLAAVDLGAPPAGAPAKQAGIAAAAGLSALVLLVLVLLRRRRRRSA